MSPLAKESKPEIFIIAKSDELMEAAGEIKQTVEPVKEVWKSRLESAVADVPN